MKPHIHTSEEGYIVTCYHDCKSMFTTPSFWLVTFLAFPIEHALWSWWPMSIITKWLGLE